MAGETILIVEDECLLGSLLQEELLDKGYTALLAHNADDAIKLLVNRPDIHIILTDIHMPGSMDGLKLSAAVRDRWPPVKIIVMSGRARPTRDELPEGAVFLPKPFPMADLSSVIRNIL
jgi:DNA-binding NtrC family response regulator